MPKAQEQFGGRKVGEFHLWLPLDSVEEIAKGDGQTEMRIGGICTTNDRDLQGETVLTSGLDWRYAKKRGWFNEEHDRSVSGGVGLIDKVQEMVRLPNGRTAARVEGTLLNTDRGKRIFEVAKALRGTGRTLGFSVQGPIIAREGEDQKTVAKAVVMDVAITRHPVNPYTSLEVLSKSLLDLEKSLDMGLPAPESSGGGNGAPLVPQSLHGMEGKMAGKGRIGAFMALPKEVQDKALKAAGVDPDDLEAEDDERDEEIEKSLERVREHLQAEKPVILDDDAVQAIAADSTGLLRAVQDNLARVVEGQGILAKSLMAVGRLAEKALSASGEAAAVPAEFTAFQDEVRTALGDMSKALRIPARPRSVQATPAVERPEVLGGSGPVVDRPTLIKSLTAAMYAGNPAAADLLPAVDVRPITREELARANVQVVGG